MRRCFGIIAPAIASALLLSPLHQLLLCSKIFCVYDVIAAFHAVGLVTADLHPNDLPHTNTALPWRSWRASLVLVKPETAVGWHRKAFRLLWTWKIRRGKPGRPSSSREVRDLIRRMSRENWLGWASHPRRTDETRDRDRETSVSKYLMRRRKPQSQTWRTFLENHISSLVSVDFFRGSRFRFQDLYVILVLAHERRRIVHFAVTAHLTAEWTAQQVREAFPWTAPALSAARS